MALKPLSESYICEHIREFYLARVNIIIAGCVRIFPPSMYPDILELGSLVVSPERGKAGIGNKLIGYSENIAQSVHKILISVTDSPELIRKYQQRGWNEDIDKFHERKILAPGKKLFVKQCNGGV